MTVLKYNHNSLLLIRASRLVPPLLFVVSMVPWVCITLPRQTQGKAQMLLHWSNKFCCVSARSSFLTVLPTHLWSRAGLGGSSSDWSILLSSAFLYSVFFFSLFFFCLSTFHPPLSFRSRSGVPLLIHPYRELTVLSYQLPEEKVPIFITAEKSHSHLKENCFMFV